jgi:hypothetical protein
MLEGRGEKPAGLHTNGRYPLGENLTEKNQCGLGGILPPNRRFRAVQWAGSQQGTPHTVKLTAKIRFREARGIQLPVEAMATQNFLPGEDVEAGGIYPQKKGMVIAGRHNISGHQGGGGQTRRK